MSQSNQTRKFEKREIKCEVLANISAFDSAEYNQLYIDRYADGTKVNKLRRALWKGIISHHDTDHGQYCILTYLRIKGVEHKLFSYDKYGKDKALKMCKAYQSKMVKVINDERTREFNE